MASIRCRAFAPAEVHTHASVAEVRACYADRDDIVNAPLCEHGLSSDLCMGPEHYPSQEWERSREGFNDLAHVV